MASDIPGTIYLLCFPGGLHVTGNRYASHYLGWTERSVDARLEDHLSGGGSPLVRAAVRSGMTVTLARVWEDVTRNDERRMKRQRNLARYCPNCVGKTGRKLSDIPKRPERDYDCDDIPF